MDNLVFRLRDAVSLAQQSGKSAVDTLKIEDVAQAADRIEVLSSHNAQMLNVLKKIEKSGVSDMNEAIISAVK